MILKIENYDAEKVKVALIKKVIADKPNLTGQQYALKLRTTRRTFTRWVKKYKIKF